MLDDENIDALLLVLARDDDLQAQYERWQDASLTGDDRAAIVHFRYTTVSNKIYRTDIQEILEKLE